MFGAFDLLWRDAAAHGSDRRTENADERADGKQEGVDDRAFQGGSERPCSGSFTRADRLHRAMLGTVRSGDGDDIHRADPGAHFAVKRRHALFPPRREAAGRQQ